MLKTKLNARHGFAGPPSSFWHIFEMEMEITVSNSVSTSCKARILGLRWSANGHMYEDRREVREILLIPDTVQTATKKTYLIPNTFEADPA